MAAAETANGVDKSALVAELRESFFRTYPSIGDNLQCAEFDERDLKKVKTSDVFLENYLLSRGGSVSKALEMLSENLKWRKQFGTNDLKASDFPRDVWETGPIYFHNHDREGQTILNFIIKHHRKDPQFGVLAKKFIVYWFERFRRQHATGKIVVLFDLTSCGLGHLDMSLMKFIIGLFEHHYPQLLAYFLVFDIPWVLNAAWKIIKSWLSKEAQSFVKFVGKNDIQKFIAKDQLLRHCGGTDTYQYKVEDHEEDEFSDISVYNEEQGRKKVTFSESTSSSPPTTPTSEVSAHSALPASATGDHLETTGAEAAAPQTSPPPERSGKGKAFITIEPIELLFSDQSSEVPLTIKLTNTHPSNVSFKVKTTSPENYKVKPSMGVIKPGESHSISVTLQEGHLPFVSRDKFLLMSCPIDVDHLPVPRLAQHWKTVPKERIIENKLRCLTMTDGVAQPGSILKRSPSIDSNSEIKDLALKVDALSTDLVALRRTLRLHTALILLLLVLCTAALLYSLFASTTPHASYCPRILESNP